MKLRDIAERWRIPTPPERYADAEVVRCEVGKELQAIITDSAGNHFLVAWLNTIGWTTEPFGATLWSD